VLGRYWKNRYPDDYNIRLAPGEQREIVLEGEKHVVAPAGAADPPSGRLLLQAEADALVMRIEVKDAVHHNPFADGGIWVGDSIQVAVDPERDSGAAYDANDTEFGVARTDSDVVFHVWQRGAGAAPQRIDRDVRRDEAGGMTRYTLRMPYEAMGLTGAGDPEFAIDVIVNDNDGAGRTAFLEWTPGIAYEKAPEIFPVVRIVR
jgi:hypothetical protein